MALEQIAEIGFDKRWAAWQQRGAVQDRMAIARMKWLLGLAIVALAVGAGYMAWLR